MATDVQGSGTGKRSSSRTRPTTPLRPSSRSSFRESARTAGEGDAPFPLNTFEPAFAELSDAMADLEANMMHFQLMHESLARFSESFASFLYGLNMNAFCVDFPEGPLPESFRRDRPQHEAQAAGVAPRSDNDADATFMQVGPDCTPHRLLTLPQDHRHVFCREPASVDKIKPQRSHARASSVAPAVRTRIIVKG